MFHVVLYQPEIPPNTGNIIRLCANCGANLHLIHPLGFKLEDRKLRRAGLDYHEYARISQYDDLDDFVTIVEPSSLYALSTRGDQNYADIRYQSDDALLFGPETRGLPRVILDALPVTQRLRVPMRPHNRSLNLSNSVAIVLYEAWRQQGFKGGR